MENTSFTRICRFCLESSDSNFEIIKEDTFANLEFLWLKLNLSISKKPLMCLDCARIIRNYSDFKTKCLEIEDCIVSSVNDKDNTKVNLREVYISKLSIEDIVNVPEDHIVCRLCLKLAKNNSYIFLRNSTDVVLKLEQCFPHLDLTCTEDAVICESCQVSLQDYSTFINNCLTTEEKIMEYCKVEGTNTMGQVDLNGVKHFISKNFLECKFEVGEVKIEGTCDEINENASYCVAIKREEILDMELDIKEDSCVLDSESTDENSFHHHPSSSQSDPEPQLKEVKQEISGNNNWSSLQKHILAHKGTVSVGKYNYCEVCPFKTKAKYCLKKHMLWHKQGNTTDLLTQGTMYKCDLCNYETKSKSHMKRHALTHQSPSEITMYSCEMCDFQAKRKDYLKGHMLSHKSPLEVTMYKCETCTYETKRKHTLQQHMLVHMNKCDVCNYETKSESHMKRHVLSHQSPSEIVYSCEMCDFKAKRKHYLKRHMLYHKAPSEVTMYKCEMCTYETKRKDHLQQHMQVHTNASEVEMHNCEVCPFETKSKKKLQRHLLSHSKPDVIMYKCDLCVYETKWKCDLKKHSLTHKPPSEIEMYKCDLCDYKTKNVHFFNRHMLIHKTSSKITMYNCETCDYVTNRKFDLKGHMLTHKAPSEVIMHKCGSCAYETKRKGYLKEHMLIHTNGSNINMHKCELCNFGSKWKSALQRHLLRHRNKIGNNNEGSNARCHVQMRPVLLREEVEVRSEEAHGIS